MEEGLIKIPLKEAVLTGDLIIPKDARGLVVFAHGSGSSRHSPRNQRVAKHLREEGLGTLLIDLLTQEEEKIDDQTRELRFNISFLARRLSGITGWLRNEQKTQKLKIGYFGASTGAAAALVAAAERCDIDAVVSRGGRSDLAGKALPKVKAPTFLLVGGEDGAVIELNQDALELLQTTKQLMIIPGATHLFEEPGALEEVANFAGKWFSQYLSS
ncbi:MAG: dienelactone hydrolase family protein [Verrucomicrobia bacterium]|nr:dienelactone hydrolase family protein [Verrucomicrobiota bacterium]